MDGHPKIAEVLLRIWTKSGSLPRLFLSQKARHNLSTKPISKKTGVKIQQKFKSEAADYRIPPPIRRLFFCGVILSVGFSKEAAVAMTHGSARENVSWRMATRNCRLRPLGNVAGRLGNIWLPIKCSSESFRVQPRRHENGASNPRFLR